MIKRRDPKTGVITFIPTVEDIEKNNLILRINELEQKVEKLEKAIKNINKTEEDKRKTNVITKTKSKKIVEDV